MRIRNQKKGIKWKNGKWTKGKSGIKEAPKK